MFATARTDAMTDLNELSLKLAKRLLAQGKMLAVAESCSGGWLAKSLTDIAGSSAWFDRGFVTYSNASKHEMLGVDVDTLERHGAVSEPVVRAMAAGAVRYSQADMSVAISGIAGPGGGSADKPVGTVWFAWGVRGGEALARREHLDGDREAVRRGSVMIALKGLAELVAANAR